MSAAPPSPAVLKATAQQRAAANPEASVWVSANAGSGKTRVLTERVARLLLGGARPERILCLTYTRAAAAEMANRLGDTLGGWALSDDAALARELVRLTGATAPPPGALGRARRLFAEALETPGGLKIQTIHAFCEGALRRFPLEAGVSPAFTLLDPPAEAALAARVRDALAEAAAEGRDDAFDRVAARLSDEGFEAMATAAGRMRALFPPQADPIRIARAFGLAAPPDSDDGPLVALLAGADPRLAQAAAILAASGPKDGHVGRPLAEALATGDPAPLAKALRKVDGDPRDWTKCPTKAVDAAHPWIRPMLAALAEALEVATEQANAAAAARRSVDLGRFGAAWAQALAVEKRGAAALDYDDLIAAANRLFAAEGGAGAWARYKLDEGVDHILVDEAQDTAPEQWRVIRALADPFFDEARAGGRTLFVVGDEKQSIYSFQGADPRLFGEERARFAGRAAGAGALFSELGLETSFRSAPAILRVVDATFAPVAEGLSSGGAPPAHAAARTDLVGRVDLWPVIEPEEKAAEPPWDAPLDAPPPDAPRLRLARVLAAEMARWFDEGEPLPGGGRPVRPGDVMVLVRRRDAFVSTLLRELKARSVPVGGADRLRIADEIAVRDLLALASFALTPGDDLTLAALLRSPLCGLSEDELFALAHGREGRLWAALRRAEARHPGPVALLRGALADADYLRPYEFFEKALTEGGARRRLLARLGVQVEDAVDELLAQALAYEQAETPSLEGFLAWLAGSAVEVRREQDKGAGEVRVMTVHGAKGLEAPVVILPDTLFRPRPDRGPIAVLDDGRGPLPVWTAPKPERPAALRRLAEEAERRERDESRRLLYVAMTRAERWLIVCGAGKPPGGESWRSLVAAGMGDLAAAPAAGPPGLGLPILRVEDPGGDAAPAAAPPPGAAAAPPLPAWATARAAPAARPRRRAASGLAPHAAAAGTAPPGADAERARARGTAIHLLLERLPDMPEPERPALAEALLLRAAPWADAEGRGRLLDEATRAMAAEGAAAFFAPGALAEIDLSLDLPDGSRASGRIDRLAVSPEAVGAVDFKTDAAPPADAAGAPEGYLRQMAVYRAALRALYPGRAVSVAFLWTAEARLAPVPDPVLDAAWARLVAP